MKFLFMVVVSCFFCSLAYTSAPEEFTPDDLSNIALLMALAFSFQILFCQLLVKSRGGRNLFLAVFSLSNIVSLNLILNEAYLRLPGYALAMSLLVLTFVIYTMMNIIDDSRLAGKLLIGVLAVAIIGVLVTDKWGNYDAGFSETAQAGKTSAENIKLVDFKDKPNVYFASFDALVPESILRQHMGVESTAYHKVLNTHFRRFPNFFADAVTTKQSLNSLLALDKHHYYQKYRARHEFFRGGIPSPLLEIFSHNGYTTNTLTDSLYFGNTKGPYVDNYFTQSEVGLGVCEFIDKKLKAYTFFGYCDDSFAAILNQLSLGFISFDRLDKANHRINADEFLIERMRDGLKKNQPQFFLSYIYSPGHAPFSFNRNDPEHFERFKQNYIERSDKAAASIQKIVDFIANEDPSAILFVFGDHGLLLSINLPLDEDKEYYVTDKYGVYGGVFPPDRCAESFSKPYSDEFMTTVQSALMIIRCLSGGEEAAIKQDEFRLTLDVRNTLLDRVLNRFFARTEDEQYERFLYE